MRTEKAILMKDGVTVPAGIEATRDGKNAAICQLEFGGKTYRARTRSAFIPPTLDEVAEAECDGQCLSVAGNNVEPDGWDDQGTPSWLLALGLM